MREIVPYGLVALGGNLPSVEGGPENTMRAALKKLSARGVAIQKVSRFYQTPCFPAGAGPDYVNAAAAIQFKGSARELLSILHEVEAEFGRERIQRWGRRTLDLDLIAAGSLVLPDVETFANWHGLEMEKQSEQAPDQLILPHPRLQDRAFVLVPLCDVASDWVHPVFNKSVAEMLAELPKKDVEEVRAL